MRITRVMSLRPGRLCFSNSVSRVVDESTLKSPTYSHLPVPRLRNVGTGSRWAISNSAEYAPPFAGANENQRGSTGVKLVKVG